MSDGEETAAHKNRAASRARTLFFCALVGVTFWIIPAGLTFIPGYRVQMYGVVLSWIGFSQRSSCRSLRSSSARSGSDVAESAVAHLLV